MKTASVIKAAESKSEDVEDGTYQPLNLDEMNYESLYTMRSPHKT